jgi:hypothetical protein
MAHIRSYFGIEREFNRYYDRLRNQLRDLPHPELDADPSYLELAAKRTFDRKQVWNSSTKSLVFNELAAESKVKFRSSTDEFDNPSSPSQINKDYDLNFMKNLSSDLT